MPVAVLGKHLVATDERELVRMHALRERADVNGVAVEVIDAAELRRREPHVTGCEVRRIVESTDEVRITTSTGVVRARHVVFCAGVQADRVARMAGLPVDFAIVPFRGEYYGVVPYRADMVNVVDLPDPRPVTAAPGVHLTPTVDGGLNVGANAVLGFAREGYRECQKSLPA